MKTKLLFCFLATSLALAQESPSINSPPPPPESSELDSVTTQTAVTTSVVSQDSSAIVFITFNESGMEILTTVTKDPGPPETFAETVVTILTLRRTSTVYPSKPATPASSIPTAGSSPSSTAASGASKASTSTTPGVSTSSSPTPNTTSPPPKTGLGTTNIVVIIFTIIITVAIVGAATFFLKKRRGREQVEERSASYRNREWNSARPPISSPLNAANLNELNGLATTARSKPMASPNVGPSRPSRPASLTESVQESMRMTPVAMMRNATGSVRSRTTAPTMMSGARSMSPNPLNIVKEGMTSRDRSVTYSSTQPQFGDYHTRSSSGVEASQMSELRDLERELEDMEHGLRAAEKGGPAYTLPPRKSQSERTGTSAGYTGHGHPPAASDPTRAGPISALSHPRSFADPDEDDKDKRSARRASSQRKLDGELLRSASTSPPIYDAIAARAEKQRLIAQKQRLVAGQQKKMGGPSKNITDFSPGPMPNYSPSPPPPGPPPSRYT